MFDDTFTRRRTIRLMIALVVALSFGPLGKARKRRRSGGRKPYSTFQVP